MRLQFWKRRAEGIDWEPPAGRYKIAERPPDYFIKVYQYQVELEGGRRWGPLFNHEREAVEYMEKLTDFGINGRAKKVVQISDHILTSKFSSKVEPELVQ